MSKQDELAARRKLVDKLRRETTVLTGIRFTPARRLRRERACTVLKYASATAIAAELRRRKIPHATKTTVTRDLHALGCVPRVRRSGPVLTEKAMRRRVDFAREHLRNPVKLAFSDETTICGNTANTFHRKQWIAGGERPLPRLKEKCPHKVSVWLSFTTEDRAIRIVRCPPTITAERHVSEVLEPSLEYFKKIKRKGYTVQEDNAPTHDLQFYEDKNLPYLKNWPPMSPDLNPVEQANAILKARVGQRAPWGVEQLEEVILEEFAAIPTTTLAKLVESFPRRLKKVIAAGGATIKP